MSLFDKVKAGLKRATDRVTGAYGEIEIAVPEGVVSGTPFTAAIRLSTTAAVHVQTLRLRLEEFEHADFTDYSERTDEAGEVWEQRAAAQFYEERCLGEFVLAQELKLEAGGSWETSQELTVPSSARPTYDGRWFRHGFKLEVVAEIPWGADLQEREVFAVTGAPWSREVAGVSLRGEPLVGPPELELRSRESVEAEISVRPRRGAEEGDWTRLKPRWVTDQRDGTVQVPPPHWGPAFAGPRCKHEALVLVEGSEHPLEPGE